MKIQSIKKIMAVIVAIAMIVTLIPSASLEDAFADEPNGEEIEENEERAGILE